ncbi:MAG: tetratricopeptide repeat protein, partial [Alphaproteobacteria bacterium]|nr:tetratricopeptide repeat protein [Alphaproteobacteria bacterium]
MADFITWATTNPVGIGLTATVVGGLILTVLRGAPRFFVPPQNPDTEVYLKWAKQFGVTQERHDRLVAVLKEAGLNPAEAEIQLPQLIERLNSAEKTLENAPKVDARTDALRADAEHLLKAGDIDGAVAKLTDALATDAQAAGQLADEADDRSRAAAASAMALADIAMGRAQYAQAAAQYRRAAEVLPDGAARARVEALGGAGAAYFHLAHYAACESALLEAKGLAEAHLDDKEPAFALILNNLAQLYRATNRLGEAEPLTRRALAIDEAAFGPDHPKVARDLNNLAALYRATNRLAEAEPLMRRALAIDEAAFGPDHPKVARDLNNLAALYRATNRLAEAEPLMRRALAIDEAAFGPDHPKV